MSSFQAVPLASAAKPSGVSKEYGKGPGPKLKGSCDRCALSKVKCDRQHPACGRCVGIGKALNTPPVCNYTVSLRTLKKDHRLVESVEPASKDDNTTAGTRVDSCSMECLSEDNSNGMDMAADRRFGLSLHPSQYEDDFICTSNSSVASQMDDLGTAFDLAQLQGPQVASAPFHLDMYEPPRLHNAEQASSYTPFGSATCNSDSICMTNLDDLMLVPTPAHSQSDTGNGSGLSCTALACRIAERLLLISGRGACVPSIDAQGFDQALLLGRQSVELLTRFWGCKCVSEAGSDILAAFLLQATISCYRMLATSRPDADRRTPLRLGAFTVDAEDEQHIKAELLRNEAARLNNFLKNFRKQHCVEADDANPIRAGQADMLASGLELEMQDCFQVLGFAVTSGD